MTPAARVQAAIELLDEIISAARGEGAAADTLIARYFKTRRYAGSKDRRAVRDLVYRAIRRSAEVPETGRGAMLGLAEDDSSLGHLFDGSNHGPAPIGSAEVGQPASLVPEWLRERFDSLVDEAELAALLDRAPLDVRVNRLKGNREEAADSIAGAHPTPHSPMGLRLADGTPVETTDAWRSGLVEVQDEGSQLVSLAAEATAGMTVLDLCAGAGGKTLALAAEMGNEGRIVAADTDRARLSRMQPRLARAGVNIVVPRLLDPGREPAMLADLNAAADLVLVDAPCSGTGTWRRNPESRWRLTPARLGRLTALQAGLLDIAAELVRPGGALVYVVCSLLVEEGRDQAAAFASRHSAFAPHNVDMPAGRPAGQGTLLTPASDRTDGFFVAHWRRSC